MAIAMAALMQMNRGLIRNHGVEEQLQVGTSVKDKNGCMGYSQHAQLASRLRQQQTEGVVLVEACTSNFRKFIFWSKESHQCMNG